MYDGIALLSAGSRAPGAELLMRVAISPKEDIAMPIREMKFVEGRKGAFDRSILCLGGQSLDMPDSLSLVSLNNVYSVRAHTLSFLESGSEAVLQKVVSMLSCVGQSRRAC